MSLKLRQSTENDAVTTIFNQVCEKLFLQKHVMMEIAFPTEHQRLFYKANPIANGTHILNS